MNMKETMNYPYRISVHSPLGEIIVQGSQTHIQYLKFISIDTASFTESENTPCWNEACRQQLAHYFSGKSTIDNFEFNLPIDPPGTEFQQQVWQALCDVQNGRLASYQQIAAAIGNKKAVRAVATANARNPIWLVIPCHRIVGSDNALRGYAGGIERKARLLQLESHKLDVDSDVLKNKINEKTKIIN
jgi:methylated-DNA-[protein]-cysteine S-methyltransferase